MYVYALEYILLICNINVGQQKKQIGIWYDMNKICFVIF